MPMIFWFLYKVDNESLSECFIHRARVRVRVMAMVRVGLWLGLVLG